MVTFTILAPRRLLWPADVACASDMHDLACGDLSVTYACGQLGRVCSRQTRPTTPRARGALCNIGKSREIAVFAPLHFACKHGHQLVQCIDSSSVCRREREIHCDPPSSLLTSRRHPVPCMHVPCMHSSATLEVMLDRRCRGRRWIVCSRDRTMPGCACVRTCSPS
jgi:hypothetical protein